MISSNSSATNSSGPHIETNQYGVGAQITEGVLMFGSVIPLGLLLALAVVMLIGRIKLTKGSLMKQRPIHLLNFVLVAYLFVNALHSTVVGLVTAVGIAQLRIPMFILYLIGMWLYEILMVVFIYIWLKASSALDIMRTKVASASRGGTAGTTTIPRNFNQLIRRIVTVVLVLLPIYGLAIMIAFLVIRILGMYKVLPDAVFATLQGVMFLLLGTIVLVLAIIVMILGIQIIVAIRQSSKTLEAMRTTKKSSGSGASEAKSASQKNISIHSNKRLVRRLKEQQAAMRKLALGIVIVAFESLLIIAGKFYEALRGTAPDFFALVMADVFLQRILLIILISLTLTVFFWPWQIPAFFFCVCGGMKKQTANGGNSGKTKHHQHVPAGAKPIVLPEADDEEEGTGTVTSDSSETPGPKASVEPEPAAQDQVEQEMIIVPQEPGSSTPSSPIAAEDKALIESPSEETNGEV